MSRGRCKLDFCHVLGWALKIREGEKKAALNLQQYDDTKSGSSEGNNGNSYPER